MDAPQRIELLGGLRVLAGDRIISRFRTHKAGALLGYLAYHLGRDHSREVLLEILWPDEDLEPARNRLNMALTSLRHQLEPPGVPAGAVLRTGRFTAGLNPAAVVTDAAGFEAAVKSAARPASEEERAGCLARALDLYQGPLLPGYYEEWVLPEQQRLADLFATAAAELAGLHEAAGDLAGALDCARKAAAVDSLREDAHVLLMRLLAAAGQPAAALQQLEELARLLREELGHGPSPAAVALARTIASDAGQPLRRAPRSTPRPRPQARRPSPPPSPQHSEPHAHLPMQFTRFFGRQEEIAALAEALAPPGRESGASHGNRARPRPRPRPRRLVEHEHEHEHEHEDGSQPPIPLPARLVTLTGPAGTGKTRLAIQVAQQAARAFAGGVWFVPLQDLLDPRRIPDAIVDALRLPRSTAGADSLEPFEQVAQFLDRAAGPALLVLDNLEQLLAQERRKSEDAAAVVRALLERCPG